MNPPGSTNAGRLVDFLVRRRSVLFVAAVLLLAAGWPIAQQLQLDRSIESLYAAGDPHLVDYQTSKSLFGGDEFAVVAFTDPKLIDPATKHISDSAADSVRDLSRRLNELPGVNVDSTQNLAELTERARKLAREKAEANTPRFLPQALRERGIRRAEDEATQRLYKLVRGILISDDDQTTTVVLRLKRESASPVPRGETIADIREIADEFRREQEAPVAVVGEPVQVHDMFEYVDRDGRRLFWWSLVALSLVIFVLFRSLRWVLQPVAIVAASIIWTNALLVISGAKLSMVSSMMNSLVTIIGVATVTHITVHYRGKRRELERTAALKQTFAELKPAIFWTCATTAVGFGALLSSEINPVRSFGLMMAIASTLVLPAVAALLPGGVLLGGLDADPKFAPAEDRLAGLLTRTARFVLRFPVVVGVCMSGLFAIFAIGLTRLDVETDFSRNFRDSSPIVQSLNFVETELGGAGTWEVNFPAPKKLDKAYLDKVRKLAKRLRKNFVRKEGEVTKIVALTDGLNMLPPLLFPTLQDRLDGLDRIHPEFQSSLYRADEGRMRIVLRGRERQQSARKLEVIAEVQQVADEWAQTELKDDFPNAAPKTTGLYVLLAFLIDSLLRDQLVSFAWAAGGIFLMMTIAFRSPVLGFLLLLPNAFPIVLVVGAIGWLGIPVNIATAMIASVSLGLTMDFTIHYLMGYRRARRRGLSREQALESTLRSVGRALVFSNVALVVGFSVLTISLFIPLIYFGVLVSVAMVVGLFGDLMLVPLILLWTDRNNA
ncbi:MAG: RND family transporter [Planctomycetaceae bacterium]